MGKLLLIMGDLATGKSTFAKLLSRRYCVNMFGKDTLKEILGDTIGFSDREENLKLSKATMELLMFIFAEFAKLNKPLILESNFHTGELECLHKIAEENGYEVLTLVLRGNVDMLHQRYINRMKNENRHPVHLSTTLDVYENFKSYVERTRREEIAGDRIEINADDFSYQADAALLEKIDVFMECLDKSFGTTKHRNYTIRPIQPKDNPHVESVIRTCLTEFGGNREGTAWCDPDLGRFSEVYAKERSAYWVVEEEQGTIVGGAGIGPLTEEVCELQKMYLLPGARGTGVAQQLMGLCLEFAAKYYKKCYLETFGNMLAANRFYQKNGFTKLTAPYLQTEHFSCDVWYIKEL